MSRVGSIARTNFSTQIKVAHNFLTLGEVLQGVFLVCRFSPFFFRCHVLTVFFWGWGCSLLFSNLQLTTGGTMGLPRGTCKMTPRNPQNAYWNGAKELKATHPKMHMPSINREDPAPHGHGQHLFSASLGCGFPSAMWRLLSLPSFPARFRAGLVNRGFSRQRGVLVEWDEKRGIGKAGPPVKSVESLIEVLTLDNFRGFFHTPEYLMMAGR